MTEHEVEESLIASAVTLRHFKDQLEHHAKAISRELVTPTETNALRYESLIC